MRNLVPSSIRSKVILLGFLVSIPVILLFVLNSWYRARSEIGKETDRMRNILDFVVLHEEQTILGTKQLMTALAAVPEVREGGSRCGEFLAAIRKNTSGYLNFGVALPDGRVVCSAVPMKTPLNLTGLPHFQGALADRSFTMGRHIVGRIVGTHILPCAYPMIDGRDRVSSVLFASIDLSVGTKFEREIGAQTPKDSVYLKVDEEGIVLSSYPGNSIFPVGSRLERSLFERFSRENPGRLKDEGADGISRLYMVSRYHEQFRGPGGYAVLGVPTRPIYEESFRLLATNLAALSLLGSACFAILWYAGNVLIVRPVERLVNASKRMGAGDLSARSGLESVSGEFGQLGRVFDETAAALERGHAESRRMQEELRAAAVEAENERAKSEAVIAAIGDGINIVDRDFRVLYQNEEHKSRAGDHTGELCYKAYHGRDGVCQGCVVDLSFRTGKIHTGELEGTRDGKPYWNEVTASPLRDASGEIVAGIEVVRNVTERKESEEQISKSVKMLSALRNVDMNILRGIDLEVSLGVVCDAIVRMGYRGCYVALAEPDRSARVAVARGDRREIFEELDIRWDDTPKGRGAFGTVVRTGRSFLCRDIQADPRFEPWRDRFVECGLRSMLAVPLKSDDGAVVGALIVCSDRPDGFAPEDVGDMETFAQQCAVAVLTAKWMESLRDANQRLLFHVNRMPMG
ncbi:MAG: GAF domain-containing protein, partial [Deltaproteobacteria bacterium]|nr:GAF domain-containing protein [Deltaproteobacteria bacterium]